jgi:hypothetical protein
MFKWCLLISVCINLISCQSKYQSYRIVEEPIVEKALYYYTGGWKIDRAKAETQVMPVVVYLPNMTCVGLNLKRNGAGGDTTVCFDRHGNKVLYYVSGD